MTLLILFFSFLFIACEPGPIGGQFQSVGPTTATTSSYERRNPDKDEGDECDSKGDNTCRDICKDIFNRTNQYKCLEQGDKKVERMGVIHQLLTNHNSVRRSLERISEGYKDADTDELKDYLEISASKWIAVIEGADISQSEAKEIVKWIVEGPDDGSDSTDDIARILSDVDDGPDILKALLKKIAPNENTYSDNTKGALGDIKSIAFFRTEKHNNLLFHHDPSNTNATGKSLIDNSKTWLWGLNCGDSSESCSSSKRTLYIKIKKSSLSCKSDGQTSTGACRKEIVLKNEDSAHLYNALSYVNIKNTTSKQNIFSWSADKDNQHAFYLAFKLLNDICDKADDRTDKERIACKRSLMCWTGWQAARQADWNWSNVDNMKDYMQNHQDQLELSSTSDFDECRASDFATLF